MATTAEMASKTDKAKYHDKFEEILTTNNSKNNRQGLKATTTYKPSPKNITTTDTTLPDKLHDLYSRFDKQNTIPLPLSQGFTVTNLPPHPSSPFTVDESVVKRMFQYLNSNKAAGLANISPCFLRQYVRQLSGVFIDIFSLYFSQCNIPYCFNTSTIIHGPKKSTASCLNAYCLDLYSHEDTGALGPPVSEINYRSVTWFISVCIS